GIYPEWDVLMKSISQPGSNDVKRIRYKQAHEAARKDVERAFGVLKKKWAIVRTPARSRSLKRITHLMYTCIILHNMIRKEKGKAISPDFYPEEQHREDDPGRQNRGQGNNARGAVAAGNEGFQNRVGNANPGQAKPIKHYNCNGIGHIARQCTHPKRPQNSEYFKDKMLLMQAQENRVVLNEEQLLFIAGGQTNTFDDYVDEAPVQILALNEDNVFQADQCDAFDSDVDEAPTAQTMFMVNLSSANPIYDEAGPSYDSDILSEVQDHDNYLDSVGEYHEYVKDNAVQVVQSNVSSMPNDALMMIINDTHEQAAQCVSGNEQNKVVNESLTAKLARYKKQVEIYEKRASSNFEKDFKQKENKYLEDFLYMKALKEKVEDKLFKQDQSLQTVHMLCKPKPFYDEKKKVAIGYKNPLYLTRAIQVQSALYNGHEIVKTNHALAVVHDSEDTLEIAEITRKRMLEKVKSPLCVEKKVKIAPPDYLKENYLETFTPQRHLTPEQIFWSPDFQF
ncbi:retrovirus-related pol polyprotein from transposon TNT 1-94, partial [Tanacetum coccineum]